MNEHAFDRRNADLNVAGLALRVGTLEGRVENLELKLETNNRELAANTALTKQIHENTESIVNAVRWFSTSKRIAVAFVATISAVAGTIVLTVKALHMLGLLH